MKITKNTPIEVKLVTEVKQCRKCKWFWGTTPPYGPYPSFDFITNNEKTDDQKENKNYFKVKSKGLNYIDPAIMQGCRKAPIMTIGINPNLSGYFASAESTRWCYPSFDSEADYAYYYRYKTIHQEKTSKNIMRQWLAENGLDKITASENGWLINIERSKTYRWLILTVLYKSNLDDLKVTQYELDWDTTYHAAIAVDNKQYSFDNITSKPYSFEKNDILAGTIKSHEFKEFEIIYSPVKYYQRIVPILKQFKELSGDKLKDSNLLLGEDVSQHDMIHCASPGWSDKFDIPRNHITNNCVIENAFIITQLLQSRPKVIIIVGFSSFKMFKKVFSKYFNLSSEFDDSFKTLSETTNNKYFLNFSHGDIKLTSRVIIVPHFSYDDNYVSHSRLLPEMWQTLKEHFNADYDILKKNRRITESNSVSNMVRIKYEPLNDKLNPKLSDNIRGILSAFNYSPNTMIANALYDELTDNRLEYDSKTKHLKRSDGSCSFCDNSSWSFPKKCEYNVSDENVFDDQIVSAQKIISSSSN